MNNDLTIRKTTYPAAKEIKASAHYAYVTNGITLDGTKFTANEYLPEGLCLVRNDTTGKYEKYADAKSGAGTDESPYVYSFPTGKSNPVILDESVQFKAVGATNPDLTAGQVLVHGAVYTGMLTGCTDEFKKALSGAIRFVD